MCKKIWWLFLLAIVIIPCYRVEAKSLNDFYADLSRLQKQKEEADRNKDLTDAEITVLTDEVNTIASSVNRIKNEIKEAEDDISESQKKIAEKKEETNEPLRFLQISSGENVYLEYIFEADSYTDFIYRYSVVSQLADYNNNLMNELKALVSTLEDKKAELAEKKSSLESKSAELNMKLVTLRANLANYKEEGTTIEEDIRDLKNQIKKYEDMGCYKTEDVTACVERQNNSNISINATGWTYPLTWGCVTSEYTGYEIRPDWIGGGHHGIDLDCVNEGTNVYAAANGVVARVVYYSSCGGNMVWVYHNVNGVPYTTVYMHLLNISVSVDQIVSPQTKIGEVGGGTTASYDSCTGGAHLHFGMAYGHNAFDFNSHSFNPRNIYSFPALIYNGGGYFSR